MLVWTAAIAAVAAVVAVAPWAYRIALVGSGFSAEILCGGVFISGRDEAAVTSEDLSGPGYAPLHLFHKTIDLNEKRVTASLFGLAKQIAIFRDGLGCTLIDGREEAALRGEAAGLLQPLPGSDPEAPWPLGEQVDLTSLGQGVDATKLDAAVRRPSLSRTPPIAATRARWWWCMGVALSSNVMHPASMQRCRCLVGQ